MVAVAPIAAISEPRVILDHVRWATYELLLADYIDSHAVRFAFDQGVLEIVSPLPKHERDALALARLTETVAKDLDPDYLPVGFTTFRSPLLQKGFEADASFYFQHAAAFRPRDEFDAASDPPPELVIEVEVSHRSLDKLPIYAAMGVPAVWRCTGDKVTILALAGGAYRETDRSLVLPLLGSDILSRVLVESRTLPRLTWVRMVRTWAPEQQMSHKPTR